jgi:hypothetical protein
MPDVAIFADTQNESDATMEHLDLLEKDHGDVIPIHRVTRGNLKEDWFSGQQSAKKDSDDLVMPGSIPFFLIMEDGSHGFGGRTCSDRSKIRPLTREAKRLAGLEPGQRAGDVKIEAWIGISLEEVHRMKDSREPCITNRWPLIEMRMNRNDCIQWTKKNGFPPVPRSSCVFCPFHSASEWRATKRDKKAWDEAVEFDERLRREKRFISDAGSEKSQLRGVPYLHSSRVPLKDADLSSHDENQLDFWGGECEGVCGV